MVRQNNRLNIMGVGVDPIRFDEAVKKIGDFVDEGGPHHVVTVNPEFVMFSQQHEEFRQVLNRANLSTADGFGIRLAAKYLNTPLTWIPLVREVQAFAQGLVVAIQAILNRNFFREIPDLITGVDLVWALSKMAEERGWSIFLLDKRGGLAPDTPQRAAARIKMIHRNLNIAGTLTADPSDPGIVELVRRAKPDLLFVAFGFPTQDLFIAQNKSRLGAKVAIGVGGSLDYIVGNRRRPPQFFRGKFEWLWRLIIPSGHNFSEYRHRISRILTAFPVFPWTIFKWKLTCGNGLGFPRALALDFGGVLNKNGAEMVLRRAGQVISAKQVPAAILFYFRFIRQLELGQISEVEVWTKFMRYFGNKRDLADLRQRMIDGFTPNQPIWNLVKKVKNNGQPRLALLTNNIAEWMQIWEKRYRLSHYFPTIIASCFVKKRKPNPEIFRLLVKELGMKPNEIVFVDDHNRNVIQARRLGMRAIPCNDPIYCAKLLRIMLEL